MTFSLSNASRVKLEGVHADLVRVVHRAIQITTVDFKVTCGLRTLEEQKVLFETGKSTTMNSRHLTGHAVDLVPLPVDWNKLEPFREVAKAMKAAAGELGVAIKWGGDWQKFIDMPHFELDRKVYP